MKIQTKQKNIDVTNFLTGTCPVVNHEKTLTKSLHDNLKRDNIKPKNISGFKNFTTGMKKIIITLIVGIIISLAESQTAFAASAVLSASPSSGTSTIGTSFNITVKIDPIGNTIDVVRGTMVFDKLSCQSITLVSGPLAIVTPSCATPNFVIGIPKGTSVSQNLLTVSVNGNAVGQANISFTGAKVIRNGVDVPFTLEGGSYNILAVVPVVTSTTTETVVPTVVSTTSQSLPDSGLQIPSGVGEFIPSENNVENISTTTSTTSVVAPIEKESGLVATVFEGFSNIPNKPIIGFLLVIALTAMVSLIYYNRKSDKNTPDRPNPTAGF